MLGEEVEGDPLEGQFFSSPLRDGRIVCIDDYRRRADALASAGVGGDAGWG